MLVTTKLHISACIIAYTCNNMYQQQLNVKAYEVYRITSKINFKLLWCQWLSI